MRHPEIEEDQVWIVRPDLRQNLTGIRGPLEVGEPGSAQHPSQETDIGGLIVDNQDA
jgi:hypothetical protein